MRNRRHDRLVRKAAVAEADLTRKLAAWLRPRVAASRRRLRTLDAGPQKKPPRRPG
jgi:hypothetical protein